MQATGLRPILSNLPPIGNISIMDFVETMYISSLVIRCGGMAIVFWNEA